MITCYIWFIILGFCIGLIVSTYIFKRSLKPKTIGTIMVNKELGEDGCYLVWERDPEDIMDDTVGIVKIKKWHSQ